MRPWFLLACGCGADPTGTGDSDVSATPDPTAGETDETDETEPPVVETGHTGQTGDTGAAPVENPYAGCVGRRTDERGVVTTYAYDGDGHLSWFETDLDGDGTPEDRADYTYVLVGGLIAEASFATASGSFGELTYDAHEHVETVVSGSGAGPTTSTYVNTHDGVRLTRSVSTVSGSDFVVTTDFDTCERWTRQELDAFGDGSSVTVSTMVYTDGPDCRIDAYVLTSGASVTSVTYTFDADGRTATETTTGSNPGSATWTWTCPP